MLAENAVCAREYRANSCDPPSGRVPAMDSICDSWEKCFRRDPLLAGRARMGAQTFAEIFNAFVEPISLKTMIFGPAVFVTSWFVLNAFLAGARRWNFAVGGATGGAGPGPGPEYLQHQHVNHLGLPMGSQPPYSAVPHRRPFPLPARPPSLLPKQPAQERRRAIRLPQRYPTERHPPNEHGLGLPARRPGDGEWMGATATAADTEIEGPECGGEARTGDAQSDGAGEVAGDGGGGFAEEDWVAVKCGS